MSPNASSGAFRRLSVLLPLLACGYFFSRHGSLGYLAGGAAVLSGCWVLQARWTRWGPGPAGLLLFAAAALALPALGAWQFLRQDDVGDIDHASYAHALWNLGQGRLDFAFSGRNLFGIHSQYTLPFWLPAQWLGGSLGLKLAQAICLLIAVFLAIRRFHPFAAGGGQAWWGALALLLCPPIASQFVFGFHPELLAAPMLILSLEAYRDGRLGRFLLWTALMAYTKETFTLATAGILILALLERRTWRWWLLPGLLCTAQMALYWIVVLPRFAPEGNHLGHFMPASPLHALSLWFRGQNLLYVLHVFLPVLPLALASPKRYLVLPLPLMAFYAAFPDPLFVQMWPNYAFPVALLAAAGLILPQGLRLAADPVPAPSGGGSHRAAPALDGRVLAACAAISLLSYPLWRDVLFVPRGPAFAAEVRDLRDRVPAGAKVLLNGHFAAPFAEREVVDLWGWRDRGKPLERYDFILIDSAYGPGWLVSRRDLDSGIAYLQASPEWIREPSPTLLPFRRRSSAP